MVKINLQIIVLMLISFIVILYMVDLYIPLAVVTALKTVAYFFLASSVMAQVFSAIFGNDDTEKKRKRKK